jgi:hypothetical protein
MVVGFPPHWHSKQSRKGRHVGRHRRPQGIALRQSAVITTTVAVMGVATAIAAGSVPGDTTSAQESLVPYDAALKGIGDDRTETVSGAPHDSTSSSQPSDIATVAIRQPQAQQPAVHVRVAQVTQYDHGPRHTAITAAATTHPIAAAPPLQNAPVTASPHQPPTSQPPVTSSQQPDDSTDRAEHSMVLTGVADGVNAILGELLGQ